MSSSYDCRCTQGVGGEWGKRDERGPASQIFEKLVNKNAIKTKMGCPIKKY